MLLITPKTKVGELLDAYPQLEELLVELSPSFAKLKNPVLRKTVAKVATLQQAAVIGNLKVNDLVGRLRQAVGQDESSIDDDSEEPLLPVPPQWANHEGLTETFDATPIIDSGGSPMADILTMAKKLGPNQYFVFITPFVPAPIIGMLREQGYEVVSVKNAQSGIANYVRRQ